MTPTLVTPLFTGRYQFLHLTGTSIIFTTSQLSVTAAYIPPSTHYPLYHLQLSLSSASSYLPHVFDYCSSFTTSHPWEIFLIHCSLSTFDLVLYFHKPETTHHLDENCSVCCLTLTGNKFVVACSENICCPSSQLHAQNHTSFMRFHTVSLSILISCHCYQCVCNKGCTVC